jgi:hypothetical protein
MRGGPRAGRHSGRAAGVAWNGLGPGPRRLAEGVVLDGVPTGGAATAPHTSDLAVPRVVMASPGGKVTGSKPRQGRPLTATPRGGT